MAARSFSIALFSALLGFCYSITSQADSAGVRSIDGLESLAAPRVLGSSLLRFTNPRAVAFPADYDVGDAFYGSVITRYITVAGGIRPYKFTSANLTTLLGANSSLALMQSGCLMGSVTNNTALTDITFTVVATDSTELQAIDSTKPLVNSTPVTRFHLFMFAGGAQSFRFGTDQLNNGLLGQGYAGKLDAIGGKGSITYSILPGTVTFNGQPFGTGASLEALGFSMAADGTIYGRGLKAGLVGFTARAKDGLNRLARNRANNAQDQIVTFSIEDNAITSSDNTMLNIKVKGNTSKLNTDSVSFNAKFNFGGLAQGALKGKRFAFLLGGNAYIGFMDGAGKVVNALNKPVILADGSLLTATINAQNGQIKGKVTKANVSANIDAINIVDRQPKRLATGLFLCDFVVAADLIDFDSKHIGSKYSLDYNIGKTGKPVGGNFQIFNLRSKDGVDIAGNPGSEWKADFVIAPRVGIDENPGFSNLTDVQVRVNQNFSQTIPLSALAIDAKGSLVYKNTVSKSGVKSLQIKNGVFSGKLDTFVLSSGLTTLPPAGDKVANVNSTFFNLAIDINRAAPAQSFKGECSKAIQKFFLNKDPLDPRYKNQWIDRVNKRPEIK